MNTPLVLTPARSLFSEGGWFTAVVSVLGFAIAFGFAEHKRLAVAFFAGSALLFGGLTFFAMRYLLKRVVSAPEDAPVVERSLAPRLAVTAAVTAGIVALAIVERSTGAVLGIGFGGGLGSAWAGRRIKEFERDDGRRILRRVHRGRRGEPPLFVEP